MSQPSANRHASLRRDLGLWDAVLLGLGSIIGTGVFVTLALAAEIAWSGVLPALVLAALLALASGLSAAQLAAAHPTSGGTYEFGYRFLTPALGFTAGWLFLCAKTASAATAALGLALYGGDMLGLEPRWQTPLALGAVVVLTAVVLLGARRTSLVNALIVALTLGGLLAFVAAALPRAYFDSLVHTGLPRQGWVSVMQAAALMFVAYTGYGRIATLGEEVRDPRRTIPRAIIVTLALTLALYLLVAGAGIGALGAGPFGTLVDAPGGPLVHAAEMLNRPVEAQLVGIAALTALLGVLLNLILGLSRVALAMSRRGDLPSALARLDSARRTPYVAVALVGLGVALLAALGGIRAAWSFSAFTVLVYYALTNLAALRLPLELRLYPRWVAVCGLLGCLGLAAWIERPYAVAGAALIVVGLLWRLVYRWLAPR